MSKFLSRAAVLTLFLLALFSCRNETFFSEAQNSIREEEFFKNALRESTNLKNNQQIIKALISKNETSHFVSKLQDDKGLPNWNNMRLLKPKVSTNKNGDNTDGTYVIPLTSESYISSILFVELENNVVTELEDITNQNLWEIINNPSLSKTKKENLLALNLYLDREIYGESFYINIPPGLLGVPESYKGKIRIKTSENEPDTQGLLTTIECVTTIINCNCPPSWGSCDMCNDFGHCVPVSTYCTVFSDTPGGGDSNPPSNGGGNPGGYNPGNSNPGGGGNGGQNPPGGPGGGSGSGPGGGNNTPETPTNPCTSPQGPFYRPMPGCGDGGEPIEDPCSTAKPTIDKANALLKDANVKTNMTDVLKNKVSASNEWGVAISKNNNAYSVTPPKEGTVTDGSIPQPLPGDYVANGHSHSTGYFGSPSGGDFYSILELISGNTKFETMYIYGTSSSGSVETYALVISDKSLATEFLSQYPKSQNLDPISHAFLEQSEVGLDYYIAFKYAALGVVENNTSTVYDPKALAMAYILERLNTGISLAKMDNSGDLKKLNVSIEKIKDAASGNQLKTGLKVTKCP